MIQVTIRFASGGSRELTKRSFVIGAGAEVDVVGDDSVRVIVRRDLGAIVRPISGTTWINGMALTEPLRVQPSDTIRLGTTELRIEVTGDAVASRWWNPRSWGDDEDAPLASPITRPPIERTIFGNPPRPDYGDNPPRPQPAPIHRAVLSNDPAEHQFLATLRETPDDTATAMVYADWLETAGRVDEAGAVRADVAPPEVGDPYWRAIATDEAIANCARDACPKRWRKLLPIADDDASRSCGECSRRVYHGRR